MGVVYMRAGEKKKLMVYFSFASHKYIDLVQFRCIYLWLNQTYFPQPIDKNRKMLYLCVTLDLQRQTETEIEIIKI